LALPRILLSGQFARGESQEQRGIDLQFSVELSDRSRSVRFPFGQGGSSCTRPIDGWVAAALGRKRAGNSRPDAQELPGQLRGGHRQCSKLLDRGFRDDAAVTHK